MHRKKDHRVGTGAQRSFAEILGNALVFNPMLDKCRAT